MVVIGSSQVYLVRKVPLHCPKNNLNLSMKTKPFTAGEDATVYVRFFYAYIYSYLAQNIQIYRFISSKRDRHVLYAEIIFGTVCRPQSRAALGVHAIVP